MKKMYAKCALCGHEETFTLTKEEERTFLLYEEYGRELGKIQDLFPRIPAWIRSGAIDKSANGFCICPNCMPC